MDAQAAATSLLLACRTAIFWRGARLYPSALISANKSCSAHQSETGYTQTLAQDAHTAPRSTALPPPSPSPPSPPPRHHHQQPLPLLQLPPFCSPSSSLVLFSWRPSFWQLWLSSSPPLFPLLTPLLVRLVSKLPLVHRHTPTSARHTHLPQLWPYSLSPSSSHLRASTDTHLLLRSSPTEHQQHEHTAALHSTSSTSTAALHSTSSTNTALLHSTSSTSTQRSSHRC